MGNLIKQQYVSCELKIVEFNVEQCFAGVSTSIPHNITETAIQRALINGEAQSTQYKDGNTWYSAPKTDINS